MIEEIKSRRSIRAYLDKPVPKGVIEEIIEAGRYAPSSLNTQPWEFAVVTDKELIKELSGVVTKKIKKIYSLLPVLRLFVKKLRGEKIVSALKKTATTSGDTVFYNAPVIIFVVSKTRGGWTKVDCSLAAENMMLQAHAMGLGSCFIGRGDFLKKEKRLLEKLGLLKNHRIYSTLIVGYPEERPPNIPERKRDDIICWK